MRKLDQLAAIIELLAVYHPGGLRILLGDLPALSPDNWKELLDSIRPSSESVHVQSDSSPEGRVFSEISQAETITSLIEGAGGWLAIVEAAKTYRERNPLDWNLFARYIQVISCPFRSALGLDYSVDEICRTYHVDRKTVTRRRYTVPQIIAYDAIFGAQMVLFNA